MIKNIFKIAMPNRDVGTKGFTILEMTVVMAAATLLLFGAYSEKKQKDQ